MPPQHERNHAKTVRDKVPQSSFDSIRQGNVVALVIAVQQSIKSNLVFAIISIHADELICNITLPTEVGSRSVMIVLWATSFS